jgi:hypothetical protein
MFYAVYHPYGTRTYSGGDELHRFETRAARDGVVEGDTFADGNYHWESVDAAEARRHFPRAFALIEQPDPLSEVWRAPREDMGESARTATPCEVWQGGPTGGEYANID